MKTCYELVGLELGPMSEKLGQSLNRRTAVREIPIRGLHNNVLLSSQPHSQYRHYLFNSAILHRSRRHRACCFRLLDVSYISFDVRKDDSYTGRVRVVSYRRGDDGARTATMLSSWAAQLLSTSLTRTDLAKIPNSRHESTGHFINRWDQSIRPNHSSFA